MELFHPAGRPGGVDRPADPGAADVRNEYSAGADLRGRTSARIAPSGRSPSGQWPARNSDPGVSAKTGAFAAPRRPWRLVRAATPAAAGVAALGLLLAWMSGNFRGKVFPDQVPAVRPSAVGRTLVTVERVRGEETVAAVGSVQPKKRTELASQLLATVLDVRVRPGDRVATGDTLVALDARELIARRREATAALTAAEADRVTRRADYERARRARDTAAVSTEEFSRAEGAFRVADAQVTRAQEAIAHLDVQLTHTRVVASGTGLVADRFVDPGDLATPGKPLLVMYHPADLELHADVPETLAPAVSVGTEVAVRIDAARVAARGVIREVVPHVRQASRSVLVKVTLPTAMSGLPLLPGMYGRVEVPVGTADRLWVPRAAVRQVGQLDLVEVANPDDTLTRRFVRVGAEAGGKVEVLSGLTAGARIALPTGVSR
jgi:membrane fusion protein, multidrug efflux system